MPVDAERIRGRDTGTAPGHAARRAHPALLGLVLFLAGLLSCVPPPPLRSVEARPRTSAGLAPPLARREPQRSDLHGVERIDDYAWLRAKDTPEVLEYLQAENTYTDAVTAPQEALRKTLYGEMVGRLQQTDRSVPSRKNGYWYYNRQEEGKEYSILCRKRRSLDAPEQVLLDLNALRGERKYIRLGDSVPSDDGNLLAYSLDFTGFREFTLRVKDLRSGEDLVEAIEHVDSFAWAADNRTLFYVTEDAAKRASRLWRHRLGTDPSRDVLVYEEKDERFDAAIARTRSEDYLLLTLASHTTSEVRWLPADQPSAAWKTIAPREQDLEYYADHRGEFFYIRTNDQGRGFRLVEAPVKSPGRVHWKELIPHRDGVLLERVDVFKNFYVVATQSGALPHLEVYHYERDAQPTEIRFEEPAYALYADENPEFDSRSYRFDYSSYVEPFSVYAFDVPSDNRSLLKRRNVIGYDASRYTSELIWASAPDGTRVPISLVYRKGLLKNGRAPLLLDGYGAYGIPATADFDAERISLLERGVVFAEAHVRGGGDLGKEWHDEGRMLSKRNTFSDFIACAEHLVKQGYTSPERLAIEGRSAGGLLIGAVVNMRPDLFRVALAGVPFVDVVNTMLDESLPLTVGEFEEWGNPKDKLAFDYMMTYSPYDNVTAQAYPAMLVESSYNDSQVMYFEPAKWVARLRARKTDSHPLLLRMDLDAAGHGGKSGRYERLEQRAFRYAFLLTELGAETLVGRR